MQSVYLNYLLTKNKTPSCKLEEAISMSPATISRIKNGKCELPRDEYARLIQAAGGDLASYDAFCDSIKGSHKIIKEGEEPVSVGTVRKFYKEEMEEMERRYLGEISRLTQQNELHLQHMSAHHKQRMEELKEDITDMQAKLDAAQQKLQSKKDTIESLHKKVSRWRTFFFVTLAVFATQLLLDIFLF
jgi:exonuclease VII large subunit